MNIDRPNNDDLSSMGKVKRWGADYPRFSRVLWFGLAIVLLAGLVWFVYPQPQTRGPGGGPGRGGGRGGFAQTPQPVGVAKAIRGDINVTVNALGTVTPLATATVRPQATGMLVKLNFTEGQMVKMGDVLAEIDPRTYQATLAQAEAQLAKDQANLANQKIDLARYQQLLQQNAISAQVLATQKALVDQTTATVQSDQANVQQARINLGYTHVVSPITGRVGLHLVDVGNIVSNGQTGGLVVVTMLDPMSVLFTVPEDNVSDILEQVNAGNTLTVDAYDRSQTNKITSGTLATVDNQIDTTTGSVKLRAIFDNKNGKLYPNQFVNVRLLVNTLHDQTIVPLPAIQRGADGTFVFVVSPDKTVNQRAVKTGVQDGEKIAITEGLEPGDTVVIDGADRLRDGAQVSIPATTTITAPSAGAAGGGAARAGGRGQMTPAVLARVAAACAEDTKKYCATPEQLAPPQRAGGAGNGQRAGGGNGGGGNGGGAGRGGAGGGNAAMTPEQRQQVRVIGCLNRNRVALTTQCAAALPAQRPRGGGGGGGGGGFP